MTARIVMPLLVVMLVASACQTTASELESVSTTGSIEDTTIGPGPPATTTGTMNTTSVPSTTTISTTTTTLPEVVVDPPTGTWHKTNPDLGGLLVDTRDMIWDGTNFYLLTRIGFGDVIVWQSSDGMEWTEHSQIGTSGTIDGPQELISVSGLLIAAGWRGATATVWIDEGDQGWAEIEIGPGVIDELVYFKGNYIALGRAFYQPEPGQTHSDNNPVMWSSPNGYTWAKAIEDESNESVGGFARGLVEGPAGLLTVAFAFGQAESEVSAVLTSTNGIDWVSHQPTGLEVTQIDGISGGETAYITFGFDSQILRSPDGITWEAINSPQGSDSEYLNRHSLAILGDHIVMSGSFYGNNQFRPGVWVYRGGGLWAVLGTGDWYNEPGFASEMVAGDGRLVVRNQGGPSGDDWEIYTFVPDLSD